MSQGWDESAQAWIDVIGEDGDWGRRYVLDKPMLARINGRDYNNALDIGCGEGRFCRMMQRVGIQTIGIDPTVALIEQARRLDPEGDYRIDSGEKLSIEDQSVDLAVAYLSLIDIPDIHAAIHQVHRVLRKGGTFLIANLQAFNTASVEQGWTRDFLGRQRFYIDHYFQERQVEVAWRGIRIANWHRPLQTYFKALLDNGFSLRHFDEPMPIGVDSDKADRYRRVPNFLIMEWQKN
jgi:SAM-dependent methyltransferase